MAVVLRLKRMGNKKRPHYRIVAADRRSPRDGRFIEELGTYHPTEAGSSQVTVDEQKAVTWLKQGARPSDTVRTILREQGILAKAAASDT